MSKLFLIPAAVVAAFGIILGASLLGGTIVWLLWPTAVAAFPGLVKAGYLAADLSWSSAVALTFVCSLLFTSQASSKSSND